MILNFREDALICKLNLVCDQIADICRPVGHKAVIPSNPLSTYIRVDLNLMGGSVGGHRRQQEVRKWEQLFREISRLSMIILRIRCTDENGIKWDVLRRG